MRGTLLGLVALTIIAAAGCSHSVSVKVEPPAVTGSAASAITARCSSLMAALPQTLGTASKVATTPTSDMTAAWAIRDTAVTLTCGMPARHRPTESLLAVDGVSWRVEKRADGAVFTAVDRVTGVSVTVPTAALPAAVYLKALAVPVMVAAPAR